MTSSDANTVENVAALAIFFAYFLELKNHSLSLGWSHVSRHQVVIMQIDPHAPALPRRAGILIPPEASEAHKISEWITPAIATVHRLENLCSGGA